MPTRREEGVECCYARQTKFWVLDPDRTLWEMYVLEGDIEQRPPAFSARLACYARSSPAWSSPPAASSPFPS